MDTAGTEAKEYARVLYVIFAIIAAAIFVVDVVHLLKMKILPVFLLPLLSFSICFENCVLYQGDDIGPHSNPANAGYFFHSLIFPIFIIVMFEVTLRLHEVRCAHFWGIPFEQGSDITNLPTTIIIWIMRVIATGIFIMNIFAFYGLLNAKNSLAGAGGYAALGEYPTSRHIWLSLVPSIVLSVVGYLMGIAMYRYVYLGCFALLMKWLTVHCLVCADTESITR
jgi:hypothetical protein